MKIYIVNGSDKYRKFFEVIGYTVVASPDEAEIACFTGGEDVTPSLYGDMQHEETWNSASRDTQESRIFEQFLSHGIPMVGICRGAQFLNVCSGGRLMQHCHGHTRPHEITDLITGEVVYVSSTHHQIMIPGPKAQLIAVSRPSVHCEWYDGSIARQENVENTAEVVVYNSTGVLCVQCHPEFSVYDDDYKCTAHYFKTLMERYVIPKKTESTYYPRLAIV